MLGWVRTVLPSRFQFKFEKRSPNWGPRNLHKECAHPNGWRDKHTHTQTLFDHVLRSQSLPDSAKFDWPFYLVNQFNVVYFNSSSIPAWAELGPAQPSLLLLLCLCCCCCCNCIHGYTKHHYYFAFGAFFLVKHNKFESILYFYIFGTNIPSIY